MNVQDYLKAKTCKSERRKGSLSEFHYSVARVLQSQSRENHNRLDVERYAEERQQLPTEMLPHLF